MATPERHIEGTGPEFHPGLGNPEKKAGHGKFMIQFPDGSTAIFGDPMEAAEALKQWREN